jgi:hypothetical protein
MSTESVPTDRELTDCGCPTGECYHDTSDVDAFPFTCEYCKRAPAVALLVFDMVLNGHTQRIKNLVCDECGPRSGGDARWSSLIKTAYMMPLGAARREK